MHRSQVVPKRKWMADRGTQSEPPGEYEPSRHPADDLWVFHEDTKENRVLRHIYRPRKRAVEYMDDYMIPPDTLYAASRVGSPLLPDLLPSDARRLIAEYARPSLRSGIVPEDRDEHRPLMDLLPNPYGDQPVVWRRMTTTDEHGNRKVACPLCGRLHSLDEFSATNAAGWHYVVANYVMLPGNPDSHEGREAIRRHQEERRQMWVNHLKSGHTPESTIDILVCSLSCKNDWWHHKRVQHNRDRLRRGQTINMYADPGVVHDYRAILSVPRNRLGNYETSWPPLHPDDYFGRRELLSQPTDEAATHSRWKRPRYTVFSYTVDQGV